MQSFRVYNQKLRSNSYTDRNVSDYGMFPSIHEHQRQGVRLIAESSYLSRSKGDVSIAEDYDSIINQSQVLFASTDISQMIDNCSMFPTSLRTGSTEGTPLNDHFFNKKLTAMKGFKSKPEQNNDLLSLQNVLAHYTTRLFASDRKEIHVKSVEKKPNLIQLRRFKQLQMEHQLMLKYQEDLKLHQPKKTKLQSLKKPFLEKVTLLVVDYLDIQENAPERAAVGISLEQYHLSNLRKNLLGIIDQEVLDLVAPFIQSIRERMVQDKITPNFLEDRCLKIKSKEELIGFIKQLRDQGFEDTLDDVIRYFFIPQELYRQQIVTDLTFHINSLLRMQYPNQVRRSEVNIKKICTIDGELITDFFQVDWKTKILICYSDSYMVLQKLPILEQLIDNFKKKLNIEYIDDNTKSSSKKKITFDTKKKTDDILTRAMNVLRQTDTTKTSVDGFLDRLSIQRSNNHVKVNKDDKFSELMLNVVRIVHQSHGQGNGNDDQLDTHQIETIQRIYPGYTHEEILKIYRDFKTLILQNEYHEIKKGFDKTYKQNNLPKNQTYLSLFIKQQSQLSILNFDQEHRIFLASQIQISPEHHDTPIDWNNYIQLRALLSGNINEKFVVSFLKNYFDPQDLRWIPVVEIESLLEKIPSSQFPSSFRFMFLQLMKNWFKELTFYREDLFDCNHFSIAAGSNLMLMKYIIHWIVGFFEPKEGQFTDQKSL